MTLPKRYLVTAALPYANGLKHVGHLAGAYLPADIYARYLRAQKRDVAFVCGSDEHGTAIPIQAMKEHTTPQAIIDKYHEITRQNFEDLGISFDIYHRTSAPIHHETAQEFFTVLNNAGELETKETEQYYDTKAGSFLADRYIKGTCPHCGFNGAYGDQCEKCGTSLSPDELINPVSTLSGEPPVKKKTTHWYLPLNRHEEFLRNWIVGEHGDNWRANVVGQCKSWIDGGLQPRAVTRDLDWGIEVPVAGADGKVLYVWFDAPIGYISATRQWALDNNRDWHPYWNDKDTKLVHFIGKDNIVFHCIIFPVMLKLHGNILPDNVPANEFLNLEGDKMSTSRNWKLDMQDYIDDFVKKENGGGGLVDALRYYLTQIAPETKDSEFTWKGFQDAANSELTDIFGNFVNRAMVLMHKLTGGKVPALHAAALTEADRDMLAQLAKTAGTVEGLIENYKFREAQFEVIDLARIGNRYLQTKEPWKKVKQTGDDGKPTVAAQQDIDNTLHICLQTCANLAILINPFLPHTARKMLHMFKVVDKMLDWENAGKTKLLSVGYSLRAPELLFRKIEDEEISYQVEKLRNNSIRPGAAAAPDASTAAGSTSVADTSRSAGNNTPATGTSAGSSTTSDDTSNLQLQTSNLKPTIQFDDFAKIDLRAGTIVHAEKVEKADKLLKLTIDMGAETRTIVSGIAQHFKPEDLTGQQVVVVANLAPRKMRGIESNGMILMATGENGRLHFIHPQERIQSGAEIN